MVDQGGPVAATAYLERLAEVFEDGVLTDAEAHSLAGLASHHELTSEQVDARRRAPAETLPWPGTHNNYGIW